MSYFYNPNERETVELAPGILGRSFWGENLMMVVVHLEAGSVLPEHSHPHEQGGIVLDGELEFTIGGETRLLSPGDVYLIPGDVKHSVQVGDSAAQVLDAFHPIREELQY